MIVPIFDGQYKQIELDQSLEHLDEILPPFADEIPSGSLALVAYTANAYYRTRKGGQSGWQRSQSNKNLALNINWVVVGHPEVMVIYVRNLYYVVYIVYIGILYVHFISLSDLCCVQFEAWAHLVRGRFKNLGSQNRQNSKLIIQGFYRAQSMLQRLAGDRLRAIGEYRQALDRGPSSHSVNGEAGCPREIGKCRKCR